MKPDTKQALGIIETRGYTPLVVAVDGAIKAARVSLITRRLVGGGLANATVTGDVGAVRAAMEAASAVIAATGAWGLTHVIARPAAEVWPMLEEDGLTGPSPSGGGGPAAPSGPERLPAVRVEPEPPAVRAEAGLPAVRKTPAVPEAKAPESELAKAARAVKKAAAPKKPRKPGGKK